MEIKAPWEKFFTKIITPFEEFLHAQTTSGFILMAVTIIALILANSPLHDFYHDFFHTSIAFGVGNWEISHSIHHWINDALMAIFFFLVGLEIKREITVGELSNLKIAILPILSAIGGMIFPAIIFSIINFNQIGSNGWGIPMATDIAFAISALILLGNRIPQTLITFLTALAIVDDLGAVVVIAIFYTDTINFLPLIYIGISFLILIALNRFGIHAILPYFIVGLFLWFFMLQSGIHATIAGILTALTIPSKPKLAPVTFSSETYKLVDEFHHTPLAKNYLLTEHQKAILQNLKNRINAISSPAIRLEHELHLPVALIIIPLFALANAGIQIDFSSISEIIFQPVSLGIILGLLVGKVLGIFGVAWIAIKLKFASLPENSSMKQIFGVSLLGGIGFTMSIFVADLAFINNEDLILQAKIGILFASLLAGFGGYLFLRFTKNN